MSGRHIRAVVLPVDSEKTDRLWTRRYQAAKSLSRLYCLVTAGILAAACGAGCQPGGGFAKSREAAEAIFQAGGKLKVYGSDRTLASVTELPESDFAISWIDLNQTKVNDEYLKFMDGLTSVAYLGLHSTNITDAGLDRLSGHSNLAEIELSYTAITDAGIAKLAQLSGLKKLFIYDTAITDAALADFKQKKPDCLVVR